MNVVDPGLLAFAGVSLLLAVTPGPDMATVTRNTLAHGRRGAVLTAAGIATALVIWSVAAAAGVAAVLQASATLFTGLRLAGAAYLAYLGVRSLLASRHATGLATGVPAPAPGSRIYRQGFLSAALNPKLGVFFVTLLPQFVAPGQPAFARMLVLGLVFIAIGLSWLIVYGQLVGALRDVIGSARVRAWMQRMTGVVLVGFAARLALERA